MKLVQIKLDSEWQTVGEVHNSVNFLMALNLISPEVKPDSSGYMVQISGGSKVLWRVLDRPDNRSEVI